MKSRQRGGAALIALEANDSQNAWPDRIDERTGEVVYFGDNRSSEARAHECRGNKALQNVFLAPRSTPEQRADLPVFFVFGPAPRGAAGRSAVFAGIAVPGDTVAETDWCVTKIFQHGNSSSYENLVIRLTLLADRRVRRSWIEDLVAGDVLSDNCPDWYRWWVESGERVPLCRR